MKIDLTEVRRKIIQAVAFQKNLSRKIDIRQIILLELFFCCDIGLSILHTSMAGIVIDDDVGLQTIAETAVRFNNKFFEVVADGKPRNLITSPLSAQVVLAMAAYGARGKTATEMRSVLLMPDDNGLGQSGYKSLIECFNAVKGVELRLANKIYTASGFAVKSAYKELTTEQFLSASQEVDFKNARVAANAINTWCEEQTNKRIKDIIDPDRLDPDTKMVLVNAVYFKGQWENKFNPKLTEDRPFHVDQTTTKSVPTMYMKKRFRFGDLPNLNARFIEIPYQGNQLSMIIILPNEVTGLKSVLENLHQLNLSESLQRSRPREIELFLPKFRIETTLDLEEALMKLGMTDMFGNAADFSGITDVPLKVSKVIQKAFIEVNEEGSEAAAATMVGIALCCSMSFVEPPPTFKVDRPYHYSIYHRATGISLFTGIVEQPKLA